MKVDNPAAFRFIFQDDIYLLNADKHLFDNTAPQPVAEVIEKTEPAIQTEINDFNYLGKNNKQFLVLVNYPDTQFMPEVHLNPLVSTLGRKEIQLDDVALVNLAHYPGATANELTAFFKPQKVLILGNEALPAGISPEFNKQQTINGISILQTFGFAEMMSSNDNKKAFWEQVKVF